MTVEESVDLTDEQIESLRAAMLAICDLENAVMVLRDKLRPEFRRAFHLTLAAAADLQTILDSLP